MGSTRQEPEVARAVADARIAWVLEHPHMSDWLKQALRTAACRDPTELQNDVEMLRHIVALCARAEVDCVLSQASLFSDEVGD